MVPSGYRPHLDMGPPILVWPLSWYGPPILVWAPYLGMGPGAMPRLPRPLVGPVCTWYVISHCQNYRIN